MQTVDAENKRFIITVIAIFIVIAGGYAALISYSNMSSPFSIVMSESMQHDTDRSQIGCIDTGDVVVVVSPEKKEIQSYVEGTVSGYSTFGDYGSVIIYNRGENSNPVIHRAIVWVDYEPSTDKWSAPSLASYEGQWYATNNGIKHKDYTDLGDTLTFVDITQSGKTVTIDFNAIDVKKSGYLTMGDNPKTNTYFDQSNNTIVDHPISPEDIKSIPVFEIPWIGTIKILMNGGENLECVPNSIPSLVMCFILIFSIILLTDSLYLHKINIKNREELEEIKRDEGE